MATDRRILCILGALLVLGACAPAGRGIDVPSVCTGPTTAGLADIEAAVHELIDRRRVAFGLPALTLDPRISEVARRHSRAMASGEVGIGHERLAQRVGSLAGCVTVLEAHENVTVITARPSIVPVMAVQEWLDSPAHRANVYRRVDSTGVGAVLGKDGRYYITQIYLRTR